MSWYITGNSYPYQESSDDIIDVFTEPYPICIFQTHGTNTPIMPISDDIVDVFTEPYPTGIMVAYPNDLPRFITLDLVNMGAFLNANRLHTVDIPDTVTELGDHAFKGTGLTSVKISSGCAYSPTTFPDQCDIQIRGDS